MGTRAKRSAVEECMNLRQLRPYFLVTFPLAWLLFLAPLAFGGAGSPTGQGVAFFAWAIAMWAPGIGALVAARRTPDGVGGLRLRSLGPRPYYVLAWLIPPLATALTGVLTVLLGAGQPDLQFTQLREAMAGRSPLDPAVVVIGQLVFALTGAILINSLFALGEELGWRGFLLPRLVDRFGVRPALIMTGVIWGLWHAPVIAQGHNYPGHPVLGTFMMVVFCVLTGIFFGWLYLRTRSVWAPTIAHASLNAIAAFPMLFLPNTNMVIGGSLTSVIGWIPLALIAVYCWRNGVGGAKPAQAR
jgi:uncharacterized protein